MQNPLRCSIIVTMKNVDSGKYQKTALHGVINVKAVYTIHYFKYGQKFAFEGESHDFWEFVYIDSGQAQITAGDRNFDLNQGEAYFHKPNEYHSIKTENRFANSVIISFECPSPAMRAFENLKTTLGDAEKELLNKIVREARECFSDKMNDVYLTKMTKSGAGGFGGEQLIRLYIEQLLILLYRKRIGATIERGEKRKNAGELTDRIKEILEENVYGSVSLTELSNTLFFSKTYIKTIFKRSTGQTVMQYFTALKIEEAKKLISCNKYTFTEIAYKLGYSSLHYFSRQFKKSADMSLTEYARSIKVDDVL